MAPVLLELAPLGPVLLGPAPLVLVLLGPASLGPVLLGPAPLGPVLLGLVSLGLVQLEPNEYSLFVALVSGNTSKQETRIRQYPSDEKLRTPSLPAETWYKGSRSLKYLIMRRYRFGDVIRLIIEVSEGYKVRFLRAYVSGYELCLNRRGKSGWILSLSPSLIDSHMDPACWKF